MKHLGLSQWTETWGKLRVSDSSKLKELHGEVLSRYAEPHRYYHTQRHLSECFEKVQAILTLASEPGEVELALWFHDAIYDPKRSDNEERSADWARSVALSLGVEEATAQRVYELIMFTCHDARPVGINAQVLVDADLSILGAQPERFDEYEEQVRKEYGWVPEPLFRHGRAKVLRGFLECEHIFATAIFQQLYEEQARQNLSRSLVKLSLES